MEPVLAMGLGWAISVCRTAEAIVVLNRHRFDPEASPLLRRLMEHAVKLRWLVDKKEDSPKAIEYGHRRYQRLLKESAEKGGWELDGEGRELPPSDLDLDTPDEWPTFKQVQQLLSRQGEPDWYAIYRLECSTSHATYLSGAVYHDESQIDSPGYGMRYDTAQNGCSVARDSRVAPCGPFLNSLKSRVSPRDSPRSSTKSTRGSVRDSRRDRSPSGRGFHRGIPAFGAMKTISASARSVSASRDLAQT
jgi:hypothetical protein